MSLLNFIANQKSPSQYPGTMPAQTSPPGATGFVLAVPTSAAEMIDSAVFMS